MDFEQHCWAEVDLDALVHNFNLIKAHAAPARVCCVVKAGAYGHGDDIVARALEDVGAQWFAVSCLSEAVHLRACGIKGDILILGRTDPTCAGQLFSHRLTQAVFSPTYARALSDNARPECPVRIHLKVDTGMGRIGFSAREEAEIPACVEALDACFELPGLAVSGIFQHFAVADSHASEDMDYTRRQHDLFLAVVQALQQKGRQLPMVHCCNSAATVDHPEWGQDMVRPGIILYGCDPSDEVHMAGLEPVLSLKSAVSQVKDLKPGQALSYGLRFTAQKPMRVATLCVGYADGYPRSLSSTGVCAIHGRPAPVLGRVCMDQMMVDATGIPDVHCGDVVTIYGSAASDSIEAVARKAGTIPYEVMCGLALRVPRIYLRAGKPVTIIDYLK